MESRRPPRPRSRNDFEIAIICALSLEADAVVALFDHHWDEDDQPPYGKARGDPNAYSLGVMGQNNIVLAHLPGMGKVAAGNIAAFCRMSFSNINLALVVGICGGSPSYDNDEILLGDVIISSSVLQYDLGRRFPDRFEIKDTLSESFGRPNLEIRSLLSKLRTVRQSDKLRTSAWGHLDLLCQDSKRPIEYPGRSRDNLFPASYRHKHHDSSICLTCAVSQNKEDEGCQEAAKSTCAELGCDTNKLLPRKLRPEDDEEKPRPFMHFGLVASGDTVLKSGEDRETLVKQLGAIAFEMESVGVWDVFPCVVIKAVCDYADSHKNKEWQQYAAASAGAYTKAFLGYWHSTLRDREAAAETEAILTKKANQVLNSLKFKDMNERRNNISPETPRTFSWIFDRGSSQQTFNGQEESRDRARSSPCPSDIESDKDTRHPSLSSGLMEGKWDSFTEWLESTRPIYWISGKPGSGKSTLMKFISSHPKTKESLLLWKNRAEIVSHFFWKPGTTMQHSFKGFLLSLLFQILSKDNYFLCRKLQDLLDDSSKSSCSDWSQDELRHVILSYGKYQTRPICVFMDALDEVVPEQDAIELLQFTKALSSPLIKVCVSSRPERRFRLHLQQFPCLQIHHLTENDIRDYSRGEIERLALNKPPYVGNLVHDIAASADGVFLWAVLVTRSVIRGMNNNDTQAEIQERLRAMPQDLMALYRDLLQRSAEDRPIYQKQASIIFSTVLAVPFFPGVNMVSQLMFTLEPAIDNDFNDFIGLGSLPEIELYAKCQRVLRMLEIECAGLLEAVASDVTRDPMGLPVGILDPYTCMKVDFIHRTAFDFLVDTEEGRSIWQHCELSQEDIWVRILKGILAECQMLYVLNYPDSWRQLNGLFLYIKSLLNYHASPTIIRLMMSLAQSSYEQGLLVMSPSWRRRTPYPSDLRGQFLTFAARRGFDSYVLEKLSNCEEFRRDQTDFCVFLASCDRAGFRQHNLIRHFLLNGSDPNSTFPGSGTVDIINQKVKRDHGTPWIRYLLTMINQTSRLQSFGHPGRYESNESLTCQTLGMFQKSGANMNHKTKVFLRWVRTTSGPRLDFNHVSKHTAPWLEINRIRKWDMIASPPFRFIVFEVNAQALLEAILGRLPSYPIPGVRVEQNRTLPHMKAIAFGRHRTQFAVRSKEDSDALLKPFKTWLDDTEGYFGKIPREKLAKIIVAMCDSAIEQVTPTSERILIPTSKL